jgi:hypothetical protein
MKADSHDVAAAGSPPILTADYPSCPSLPLSSCRIVISSVTSLFLFCPTSRIAVVAELPEARAWLGFQAGRGLALRTLNAWGRKSRMTCCQETDH